MPNTFRSKQANWTHPTKVLAPAIAPRAEAGRAEPIEGFLLCIDMQPAFLTAIADKERLQAHCAFALAAATGVGLPVLFTEQVPAKLGGTAPDLLALCPTPEVLGKDSFSSFGNEKIAARLRASGAKQLYLCGIETPICVYQTARDAVKAGFHVTILADCVGARRASDAALVLANLTSIGCAVLPAETVFYGLLKSARHPFFRDFNALVKKHD